MFSQIKIAAPAKVNIGLNVLPRRVDGFHNLESIFQTVGLCDYITVTLLDEENVCEVSCDTMELPADNTITSTYRAFCSLTGKKSGVKVALEKHIPSGGGLGGGSSDGAFFLYALAQLTGVDLTDSLKDKVASLVGSDVFFFLHGKKNGYKNSCAVVTGRGDVVKAIEPRKDLYFLLIFPEVHSSTKEAYELVDNAYETGNTTSCPELTEYELIYNKPVKEWTFANSFTSVLVKKYPVIGKALQELKESGAVWSDMSGSGATVFGVFDTKEAAEKAFSQLKINWNQCVLTQ